jgi:ligand-binding sensor domain-containing protein
LSGWVYRNYTGLGSGKVTSLASIGRKVIAATEDSGIYISNDFGVTWNAANNGISNLQVLSLSNNNSGKIFAGTNGGGVFMSADSGASWSTVFPGISNPNIIAIASSDDTVLVGTAGGGVFASINGGGAYTSINSNLSDLNITSIAASASAIYVGTPSGVFQASTSFPIWTQVITGLSNTEVNTLYVTATDIYAGTNAGVFISPLSGISWSAAGSATDTVKALISYGTKLLAGTTNRGVLKSTMGTFTWAVTNSGFNNLQSYATTAIDSTVLVSNEQGVFVCKNFVLSAVYVKSNNGLDDSLHVSALQINAAHTIYAGTKNAGVYVSVDSGATWVAANTGLTSLSVVKLLATPTKLYAATSDGKVFSTPQGSISWSDESIGLPANAIITALADAGNDTLLLGTTVGVYANIGSGVIWVPAGLNQSITALTFKDGFGYAGTDTAGVFKASFANPVWVAVNTNLTDLHIQSLYATGVYVVVGYKGGAKASCNGAKTWRDFNILQYIPNFGDVIGFADITPRIFALTPAGGIQGNAKSEFPEAEPLTPSTITGASPICGTSPVTFSVTDDVEATTYQWTLPNGWTGTSSTNSITATPSASNDTIRVSASNGCGTSEEQLLNVPVDNFPTVTLTLPIATICDNASAITLTGGTPVGGNYSGNGVTAGNFNPATAGLGSSAITYLFTTALGCSDSATANITVTTCIGINEAEISTLAVYPNPFNSELVIKANVTENTFVLLTDVTGKAISTTKIIAGLTTINTSSIAKGVYFLHIVTDGKTVTTQKVVKAD